MGSLESLIEGILEPRRDIVVPLLFGPGDLSSGFVALTKIEKGLKKTYKNASIVDKQLVDRYGGSPATVERLLAKQENVFLVFFFISGSHGVKMEASEFISKHCSRCFAFLGPKALRHYLDYFATNAGSYEADILRHLPGNHIRSVGEAAIDALESCEEVPSVIDQVRGAVDHLAIASELV